MIDNQLKILLYHGVTNCTSSGIENNSGKHIDSKIFQFEMQYIKDNCNVLSMSDVISVFESKKSIPKNSVAVTFDDGFANNYSVAAPILKALEIPATFYITTGIIGTDKMFWVDQLESCINLTHKTEIAVFLGDDQCVFNLSDNEYKIEALKKIKKYCKNIHPSKKDKVVEMVSYETGVIPSVNQGPNYRAMTWEEVQEMNSDPLFTFGGHNVTHDTLSYLSRDEMRQQIRCSIEELEENLGEVVENYSYPEGQSNHFNNEVILFLQENGIKCCPTAINGINTLGDDLFHLKRIMVGMANIKFPYKIESQIK